MKVSLNTIKQYTDVDMSVDELVTKINAQLGGVEKITNLSERYKDAVIVKVIKCEKHTDADKLSVCEIDVGTGENVQVVCGAPNAREGMIAVWLPPKSIVPASFDDKEPFVLEARELRGVVSNGMLASPKELAIGDSHEGLLEITEADLPPQGPTLQEVVGRKFAEVFGLADTIIDIENKMFTHRPDLFGQLGVAREIAGIQGKKFTSPDWYLKKPEFSKPQGPTLQLEVDNGAKEKVPRFMSVALKDVTVKPSPVWLQCELVRLGGKPINNIVDVTNYVMLLTAQPTHAYDYDKLRGHKLGTRLAKEGEKAILLNGKTYEFHKDDIVIVDGEGVVGLAGIIGAGNSEVSVETKNVVLEVATFDMYTLRHSSMRHGLFTDALTRFNKGQSPLQNDRVLNLLMMSIKDVAGGEQASEVFDKKQELREAEPIEVTKEFINERLGHNLSSGEIKTLLENVELKVDGEFSITPAFWRTDLELPEDIVEEVGRLYGFDKIPRTLPSKSIKSAARNKKRELKKLIRESLSRAGGNEVLTYSFVHEKILKNAGQNPEDAYELSNSLSPDLRYYRLSVLPSLLDKVHPNIKAGHDEFVLFELGKGHHKQNVDEDGLPNEGDLLELVYASKTLRSGAAYFQVRRLVKQLAADLGFTLKFIPIKDEMNYAGAAAYEHTRSALVQDRQGNTIGMIGELKQSIIRGFKLPKYSAAATFYLDALQASFATLRQQYSPLSRYPSITQDISLKVDAKKSYEDVFWSGWKAISESIEKNTDVKIEPVSIYQAKGDESQKTITLRVTLTNSERTMSESEVSAILDTVATANH